MLNSDNEDSLEPWPQRLTAPSPRLQELGIAERTFETDTVSLMFLQLLVNSLRRFLFANEMRSNRLCLHLGGPPSQSVVPLFTKF